MDEVNVSQQYYIATKASPADDRARVLKYGSMFAVFDRLGDIVHQGMGEQGIFSDGTRHLSEMQVRLWEERGQDSCGEVWLTKSSSSATTAWRHFLFL